MQAGGEEPIVRRPKLFAVTGAPILHSLSPVLFKAAFEELGIDAVYTRLAVDDASEALRMARELGLAGMNVTSPLKENIAGSLDSLEDAAERIGAVNTVVRADGSTAGYNTDPVGVDAMLRAACTAVGQRRFAVLGAGGAACAAAYTLLAGGAEDVVLINRNLERGRQAAAELGCRHALWDRAAEEIGRADAVFSCLPTLVAPVDPAWLRPGQLVLDANYKSPKLADVALQAGCVYGGGRAWLLGQAVAAFRQLTGEEAPADTMERALIAARKPRRPRRFVMCGMMGTGKTTVGRALADALEVPFLDIDRMVESAAGASIPEVFRQLGEPAFRRMEARAVSEAMQVERGVISLGGGALLDDGSRRRVRERATAFWLWASPETCARRAAGAGRPLLEGADPQGRLQQLLDERLPTYAGGADLIVDTSHRSPAEVAEKIIDEVRQTWPG